MMRFLVSILLLVLASPASAWWDYGHRTIATIAWKNLTPETRSAVHQLLRQEGAVETPACPLRSIEDASTWPDCIKGLGPRFDYAFSWHFQNVDVCKPFDLSTACKDGNCVSRQIDRNARLLADPSVPPRERLIALAFLTHFVGDLHMPLHAGDRSDRGGNDVKAAYGLAEGRINLHLLWGGYLAERSITTPPADPEGILSGLSPEDRAGLAKGTTEDWNRESWQLARDKVYAIALDGDPCAPVAGRVELDDGKIESLIPVVRSQMLKGGLRLARMLDEALRKGTGNP